MDRQYRKSPVGKWLKIAEKINMQTKEIIIGGLAKNYGTPLYVYDTEVIRRCFDSLTQALTDSAEVFYSFKANPNISICAYLKSLGARAEVCSLAELEVAVQVGFSHEHIIFVGPAKSDAELRRAIALNIFAIVCESLHEITRVEKIAREIGITANVALRINPSFGLNSALLKMGGKASQFGVSADQLPDSIQDYTQGFLHFRGIHIYNGTRVLNSHDIIQNTAAILDLAKLLAKKWNVAFEMVDMGGGFGVPYHEHEATLDLLELEKGMSPLLSSFKQAFPHTHLIFESGRYLVAESGTFVTQICDVKESHGQKYLITDGGTNCHMAAIGINTVIKRNFPIYAIAPTIKNAVCEIYQVAGPLCTPGDVLAKNIALPSLTRGDYLAVTMSGAYGPTASPTYFLSHGYPSEVLLYHEQGYLIRQRDSVTDILANQQLLDFL